MVSAVQSPLISVIIVTFNNEGDIGACLDSMTALNYPAYEVLVVDNASTDATLEIVQRFPTVRLFPQSDNQGFAGGNNIGAEHAQGDFLAFVNPDTTADPDWLTHLLAPLQTDASIGMSTAKILLMQAPDTINTCGNIIHYTGISFLRGDRLPADAMNEGAIVAGISGCAFMISARDYEIVGGFDAAFFPGYVEDTDLSWRITLYEKSIYYVPEAVVYHHYTPGFSPNKYFWIERNRCQLLLKNYRWRTLFLLLPALLLAEVISWGFAMLNGFPTIRAKLRSYGWVLTHWRDIITRRRTVQRQRKVTDRVLLQKSAYQLAYGQADDGLIGKIAPLVFDPLFLLYRRFLLLIVRW